jgi:hypothetical protein
MHRYFCGLVDAAWKLFACKLLSCSWFEEHDVVVLGMFAQEWRGISELQERWE